MKGGGKERTRCSLLDEAFKVFEPRVTRVVYCAPCKDAPGVHLGAHALGATPRCLSHMPQPWSPSMRFTCCMHARVVLVGQIRL